MAEASIGTGRAWTCLRCFASALLVLCVAFTPRATHAQFRARDRILEPVDASRWSVMRGNLRPAARAQFDRGELDPATRLGRVTMFFSRTPEQEADLLALLDQLQDRSSANYHRWLSPEEFADRFGVTQGDLDKIVAWLQAQGLAVEQVSRSRSWVAFSGSARQVEAALRTDLRRYAVGGRTHFAMSREPSLPSALAGVVLGFRGLDSFRLKPRAKKIRSRFTSEFSPGRHFLAPGDLATIYNLAPLYAAGIDGANQKIAVLGQTAINISDVRTFRSLSGLPANDPQVILVPGSADPGLVEIDIDEANLDLDWVGAVARRATILYVYADPDPVNGNGVLDALTHVIDQNLAPVISMSYGLCEGGTDGFTQSDANILASIAQQGNAKGITIVAPTGDSGAADCDLTTSTVAEQGLSVDLPGATPYVTSVGGTRFSGDASDPPTPSGYWGPATNNPSTALSYIPETSWNDTDSSGLAATGGGGSSYFSKPSWQTGPGVPNDGARDVPDVSFNASANHDGYLVCSRDVSTNSPTCVNGFRMSNDDLTVFGGTSAGVPVFAGIVALLNQQANSPQGQGNINYILYPLAAGFPAAFHDVTSGNNMVPCRTTPPPASPDCPTTGPNAGFLGFSAGPGYDLVTGLGSLDAYSLVTAWTSVSSTDASKGDTAPDFQLALSPPKLTVSRGGSATANLTLISINGFGGTISVTCVAAQPLSCSVSNQSGNSRTITVSAASSGIAPPLKPNWPPIPIMLVLSLVAAAGLWAATSIQNRRARWAPGLAFACMLIACKGGSSNDTNNSNNPGATAGSVTVQGTSGSISHTVNLSITLN